jgi:hypothetical protein
MRRTSLLPLRGVPGACAGAIGRPAVVAVAPILLRATLQPVVRRTASSAAHESAFLNSIDFGPKPDSTLDEYTFRVRIPDTPVASVDVFGRDKLSLLADALKEALGAKQIALVTNGVRLLEPSLGDRRVSSLFGSAMEIEVDGLRWSVNEGFRLSNVGRVAKRSLVRSYTYMLIGATTLFAAALATWKAVVPKEKQRIY